MLKQKLPAAIIASFLSIGVMTAVPAYAEPVVSAGDATAIVTPAQRLNEASADNPQIVPPYASGYSQPAVGLGFIVMYLNAKGVVRHVTVPDPAVAVVVPFSDHKHTLAVAAELCAAVRDKVVMTDKDGSFNANGFDFRITATLNCGKQFKVSTLDLIMPAVKIGGNDFNFDKTLIVLVHSNEPKLAPLEAAAKKAFSAAMVKVARELKAKPSVAIKAKTEPASLSGIVAAGDDDKLAAPANKQSKPVVEPKQ